jgi:hypothetical protein
MSIPVVKAEQVRIAAVPEKATNTILQFKRFVNKYFYFCMSLLFAALVMWGFSRTVNDNLFHAAIPRPALLWIHGAAFSGWVIFFIAQSTLVRIRKVSWHRFFGWFGAALAAVMVPLGVVIAIIMARFDTVQLHQSGADAFLSIPFFDMIVFGVSVALAIYWRTRPEFHAGFCSSEPARSWMHPLAALISCSTITSSTFAWTC